MSVDVNNIIAECTAYDFKSCVEVRKPESWLKSVSAFANGQGGSLFWGIDDAGNVIGVEDVQQAAEAISDRLREYMDPSPDVELVPHHQGDVCILELKVASGSYTPYYYVGDGSRMAFVRIGNESVPATSEQMQRLVLKGTNRTYDSLVTEEHEEDYSFALLSSTYKERLHQTFEKKYLKSFGLVTEDGRMTNAGLLFSDYCPLKHSRLYCTRWDGNEKDNAINDAEFEGTNILLLLREGMDFIKANTRRGWEKLPDRRKNTPEYAERALLEALVNHLIHRDYTMVGGEVHLDVYDDRICITSPGGMYNGRLIQELDISEVSSERRNPVLANVMSQLDYMEKRGSGLKRICEETSLLDGYEDSIKPMFKSSATQFSTTIMNVSAVKEKSKEKSKEKIIAAMQNDPSVTTTDLMELCTLSESAIYKIVRELREEGVIKRRGGAKGGHWEIVYSINFPANE